MNYVKVSYFNFDLKKQILGFVSIRRFLREHMSIYSSQLQDEFSTLFYEFWSEYLVLVWRLKKV